MTDQVLTVPARQVAATVVQRVPGLLLQGRYEGGGYLEDRYLVVRPDGQPVLLTHLLYLILRHADGGSSVPAVAERVGRDYGRRLTAELLARLVEERLVPAGLLLQGAPHAAATEPPRAEPFLAVTLSQAFLPARVVRRLAGWFTPLFRPAVIAAVVAAVVASDLWLLVGSGLRREGPVAEAVAFLIDPVDVLALLGLLVLVTLFHELGHAAGCRYGGGRPGAIGAGLYLWFLVFWTDVTDAYRLDRPGRLRTDLGGIYFNGVFIVVGTIGYALSGWAPLAIAVVMTNVFALQQLLPVIRMDGYYILGDLTGVPNLFGLLRPVLRSLIPGRPLDPRVAALRPGVRRVVAVWSVASALALSASLVYLVISAPRLVGTTWSQVAALREAAAAGESISGALVAGILVLVLVLPFVGFGALVARALHRGARPARSLVRRRAGKAAQRPNRSGDRPSTRPSDPNPEQSSDQPWEHIVDHPAEYSIGTGLAAAPSLPRLSAADLTEETMLRPHRRPPRTGWRRQVFLATGGLVHPGPSAAERREADLIARVRTRLGTPRRVVVLSRKGGAGKTTTTLMLGHTLAIHRGDRVVALDANPDAGSLPYRVERESSATVTSLLADADRLTSYAQVRAHTSQAPSRLEIVASDDDPKITHALGQADYTKVIQLLNQHYMLMLMDTGTGILDDATQGLLGEADQIVVVMPPALDGARVAASTLDWLDEHGYRDLVRCAVAVINGVRTENGLVQLEAIEGHFRARCSGVVQIPWDRALEAGARTALEELRPATRAAYLELAAQVAESFTGGSGRSR
jgi:putative peptide zinc metalloprotease protein